MTLTPRSPQISALSVVERAVEQTLLEWPAWALSSLHPLGLARPGLSQGWVLLLAFMGGFPSNLEKEVALFPRLVIASWPP